MDVYETHPSSLKGAQHRLPHAGMRLPSIPLKCSQRMTTDTGSFSQLTLIPSEKRTGRSDQISVNHISGQKSTLKVKSAIRAA